MQTFWRDLESADMDELNAHYRRLESEARETLGSEGFAATQIQIERLVDLRYPGQTSEITINVPDGPVTTATLGILDEAFQLEHENSYGYRSEEGEKVEIVNVRLRARGFSEDDFSASDLARATAHAGGDGAGAGAMRRAYFGKAHGWVDTPVLTRADLDASPRDGPVIIEEYDATVVVPPQAAVSVDEASNIRIDIDTA